VIRRLALAVAFASVAGAIVAARPHATPGPYLRDFEAYWSAGSAWNAHSDPYGRAIWLAERTVAGVDPTREELLPFVGPPATLPLWSLFARLPYPAAAVLWTATLAFALLVLVFACVRASGRRATLLTVLAALALAVSWGPVTSDLALGQLALPAFAAAILVVLAGDAAAAYAALAASVAFAQPNASLGLVSQLGRNRTTLALAAGAIITYALGSLAAGPGWPLAYARTLAAHSSAEGLAAIQITPAAIAFGFGATPAAARALAVVVTLLAIAGAIAAVTRVRERFARFAALSALIPFVASFVHEHDLLVAYAAAVWGAQRTNGSVRIAALAGTLLVATDWLGLAQRPSGVVQSALLAVAAFAAFVALGEAGLTRGTLTVAAAFAVLFAAMSWLGVTHPAPIWPDALGAYHAPASATAAAVWSAEQRQSGLLAQVPAWALLRSLSLGGCALLAYAICRRPSCCRTA
jgi:hypothetical protein